MTVTALNLTRPIPLRLERPAPESMTVDHLIAEVIELRDYVGRLEAILAEDTCRLLKLEQGTVGTATQGLAA